MKLGEINVQPPHEPGLPWRSRVELPEAVVRCAVHTDQDNRGQLVVTGEGADAVLAIQDLWKNVGRAYLSFVAEHGHATVIEKSVSP